MTLFAIFQPKPGTPRAPAAVPEKFSWFAFLLPPVWASAHGLWLELLVYIVKLIVLGLLSTILGGTATFWLYVLLALWIGFSAASIRRAALSRGGWSHSRDLVAAAPDLATLAALESK